MSVVLGGGVSIAAHAEPHLVVTSQQFSVPSGVSYDPDQPITVDLALTNHSDVALDLEHARWRVRRVREMVGNPRDIWRSEWVDLDVIASGSFKDNAQLPQRIEPGASAPMTFTFTPGRYGSFSVLMQTDTRVNRKGQATTAGGTTPLRLTTVGVIRPPVQGVRPWSPYQVGLSERPSERTRPYLDLIGRWGFKQVRWGLLPVEQRGEATTDAEVVYDFDEIDRVVDALREHGVQAGIAMMSYHTGGFLERPTLGGRPVSYLRNRKANLIVDPSDFGAVGEPGTWADWVHHLLKDRTDVFTRGFIRNEPWEGGSISNYHATAEYMREALRVSRGVAKAIDPDFRIVGMDSAMNTIDQVIAPGAADLLDGMTVHEYGSVYRGNFASVLAEHMGWPVYQNENWSGPSDAFVVVKVINCLASGMVFDHPVSSGTGALPLGVEKDYSLIAPRPIAQVAATMLHFIEDTRHAEDLWPTHAPHVHLFAARDGSPDPAKHAAVVFGRSPLHGPSYDPNRTDGIFPGINLTGTIALPDPGFVLTAYDLEGNEVPRQHDADALILPLTDQPYYVVSAEGLDDLRQRFLDATVDQDGQPFQAEIDDFTSPLTSGQAKLQVRVRNLAATPQTALFDLNLPEGLTLNQPLGPLTLAPGEQREVRVGITARRSLPANRYPVRLTVRTDQPDAEHALAIEETLHEALIHYGTPTINGSLDDWAELGAKPVYVSGGLVEVDVGEALWFPMDNLQADDASAMSARFATLWDEDHFYIAAEVRDPTEDFRPSEAGGTRSVVHRDLPYLYWDNGRKVPLFRGSRGDGIKLAFDVLPVGEKDQPLLPREAQLRLDPRYETLHPDHEIDLYPARVNRLERSYEQVLSDHLASIEDPSHPNHRHRWPEFEGPAWVYEPPTLPEAWRFMAPGVPLHNAFPFTALKDRDQALLDTVKMEIRRTEQGWVYEAAIPWSELSAVKPEPGKAVNFAFYVLDAGRQKLKWTDGRSAGAERNVTLHPTWLRSQAIRTKWGFQPPAPPAPPTPSTDTVTNGDE
ncbi:MAG: hypothetical protein AAF750_10910 [Planctomycetota bacterium]